VLFGGGGTINSRIEDFIEYVNSSNSYILLSDGEKLAKFGSFSSVPKLVASLGARNKLVPSLAQG